MHPALCCPLLDAILLTISVAVTKTFQEMLRDFRIRFNRTFSVRILAAWCRNGYRPTAVASEEPGNDVVT